MSWIPDDPLADAGPPRHALESDSEEDEYNPLKTSSGPKDDQQASVKIRGENIPQHLPLIIVSEQAGAYWSKGGSNFLGEQIGSVHVNSVQVGLILPLGRLTLPLEQSPPALVISSEVLVKLPIWAMYPYAQSIIDSLNPSRVTILDTYASLTYIHAGLSETPFDAPMRYLSTESSVSSRLTAAAELFKPPNLISSTSAAFLSLLSLVKTPANAIYLPSKQVPPRPPKTVEPSSLDRLTDLERQAEEEGWSDGMVQEVTDLLLELSQVKSDSVKGKTSWHAPENRRNLLGKATSTRGARDVGEGAMYI